MNKIFIATVFACIAFATLASANPTTFREYARTHYYNGRLPSTPYATPTIRRDNPTETENVILMWVDWGMYYSLNGNSYNILTPPASALNRDSSMADIYYYFLNVLGKDLNDPVSCPSPQLLYCPGNLPPGTKGWHACDCNTLFTTFQPIPWS